MSYLGTPPRFILYVKNTQVIQITGLQDFLTQGFIDDATITGTLFDQNNTPVPECVDLAFDYVAASNGNYQVIFGDEDFNPPIGTGYTLVIDGSEAAGDLHLELQVEVKVRKS